MSFWQGMIDFFFPVKCCACKTLISRDAGLLCHTCLEQYLEATQRLCPICVRPLIDCDCPNHYMGTHNLHTLIKLYRYQPGESDLSENRIIFRMKKTNDITVMQFLANELTPGIRRHMKEGKEYVLVGVPRSGRRIRECDGDHTALLCRELSRRLAVPYVPAIRRIKDGKAQKGKRRRERIESAGKSYGARTGIDLKGKIVILVDDVATSGATLVACARVIRKMGGKTIICAVAGVAFRYRDMLTDPEFYAERRKKYGI